MARKKTRSASIVRYRAPAAAKPIIIRASAPAVKHRRRGRRRHHAGGLGIGGSGLVGRAAPYAIGGAIVGFVDKNFPTLPTVPVLGRLGTIAAGLWFLSKGAGIMGDAAKAATAIAGYQLGHDGKISGVDGVQSTI